VATPVGELGFLKAQAVFSRRLRGSTANATAKDQRMYKITSRSDGVLKRLVDKAPRHAQYA
jgi:hypothetical protein